VSRPVEPGPRWRTCSSSLRYENPWIRVLEDEVIRPDGSPGIYGVVELRQPAVFVVPVTDADEVVLVEVDRYTVGPSLEVPAGGTDGEDVLAAAQRELREETELAADDWLDLGAMWARNGVCRAPERVLLARRLREAGGSAAAEEGITAVRRVPWPELWAMVATGEITDSETLAAILRAAVALGRVT